MFASKRLRWLLYAGIAIAIGIFIFLLFRQSPHTDFSAFYCAGQALLHGSNPYFQQPLLSCQEHVGISLFTYYHIAVPAPMPPYVMPFFALLAMMPYALASTLWLIGIFACVVTIIILLQKMTKLSWIFLSIIVSVSILANTIAVGGFPSYPLLLFVVSCWFFTQKKFFLAGILLGCTMIEPNLGLPGCLVAFCFIKELRIPLAIVGAVFAGLWVSLSSIIPITQYFTQVLPSHALSEIGGFIQYGSASIFYDLGVGAQTALHLASIQYLLFIIFGGVVGYLLKKKYHEDIWLIVVPVAFATCGGTFMHGTELPFTLPAILLLLAKTKNFVYLGVLALVFTPFLPGVNQVFYLPQIFIVLLVIGREVSTIRSSILVVGTITICLLAVFLHLSHMMIVPQGHTLELLRHINPGSAHDLAEMTWHQYIAAQGNSYVIWIAKLPVYAGLLLLIFASFRDARHKNEV